MYIKIFKKRLQQRFNLAALHAPMNISNCKINNNANI